jgi:ribosomal protein L11 methylase PrmA
MRRRCSSGLTSISGGTLEPHVPYRIDISSPPDDALDRLVHLGALDIETTIDGLAAIIPDGVPPETIARALGASVSVSAAIARDDESVWLLSPRPVLIGNTVLRLSDSSVFGTGHHPTTALCIEALEEALSIEVPDSILDVGAGSGVLALAALLMGVPRAVGLDIDPDAVRIAGEHARLNNLEDRVQFVLGRADAITGSWPLVVANVLAAPLIEMAPSLVRRVGHHGRLILSGIPESLEPAVRQAYEWLGMRHVRSVTRAGWAILVVRASW